MNTTIAWVAYFSMVAAFLIFNRGAHKKPYPKIPSPTNGDRLIIAEAEALRKS